MKLSIDQDRLNRELEELGVISDAPAPAVTRVVFTEADLRGRAFVKSLCQEAGLQIREDAVGNMFARWVGAEPELAAVGTGSHIDAIPNAGRFDWTVGVLGGLEAIRALARSEFHPRRSLELLVFTAEEPTRYTRARVLRIAMATRLTKLGPKPVSRGLLSGVRLPASRVCRTTHRAGSCS